MCDKRKNHCLILVLCESAKFYSHCIPMLNWKIRSNLFNIRNIGLSGLTDQRSDCGLWQLWSLALHHDLVCAREKRFLTMCFRF